ncbi:MAG TPA: TetR family transcriptional regulator [Steroidobacteraceae bacterium]|nr:TetR family transcriptional regulator [Steroidobacteraceae bacterium]
MARRRGPFTPRGRETIDAILVAAEDVLITAGYAGFTARKVAESAGIALGNLTYHFASLSDLRRALVDFVLQRYLRRWQAFREGREAAEQPPTSVASVLEWLITDAVAPRTTKLFRELWAMAAQFPDAAAAMDDFYAQGVAAAAEVLRSLFPDLPKGASLDIAKLMAVTSEGSIVLFGTLPNAKAKVGALHALVTRAVESLASSESRPHSSRTAVPRAARARLPKKRPA